MPLSIKTPHEPYTHVSVEETTIEKNKEIQETKPTENQEVDTDLISLGFPNFFNYQQIKSNKYIWSVSLEHGYKQGKTTDVQKLIDALSLIKLGKAKMNC